MNKNNLKKLLKYSLSDSDIRKALKPNKVNIILYQNLPKYNNIKDLFQGSDVPYCVLFIPENLKETSGHWTCIINHKNKIYEFFDPYKNVGVDGEMKFLNKQLKNELHFNKPLLHDLFVKSGVKNVIVNHYPFQAMKPEINDCGDEVVCRLLHHDMSLNQYWKFIKKSKMGPDEYVTLFTHNILGK